MFLSYLRQPIIYGFFSALFLFPFNFLLSAKSSHSIYFFLPEIYLVCFISVLILYIVFKEPSNRDVGFLSFIIVFLILITYIHILINIPKYFNSSTGSLNLLHPMISINSTVFFFKIFIGFFFLGFLAFNYYKNLKKIDSPIQNTILILVLLVFFFCVIIVSSTNLFLSYICLEGITLTFCGILVISKNLKYTSELMIKYFIINASTTTILLFGISKLFLITNTLNFREINLFVTEKKELLPFISTSLTFCIIIIIFSFLFKLNLAPFHFWSIEIYGNMSFLNLFLVLVPIKTSLFINFINILYTAFISLHTFWKPVLIIIGIISIILGSIGSLFQDEIKTFIVYSSITQSGLIILSLGTGTINGCSFALLHLVVYITVLGFFFFLITQLELIEPTINFKFLTELNLLTTKAPESTRLFYVIVFSLSGLPPFLTFFTKLNILINLFIENYIIIIILILILNIINIIYYSNLLRDTFFINVKQTFKNLNNKTRTSLINLYMFFLFLVLHCLFFLKYNACLQIFHSATLNLIFIL